MPFYRNVRIVMTASILATGSVLALMDAAMAAPTSARVDMAVAQQKQVAKTLLQNKDYEGAYNAFMNVLRTAPDDDDVNFGILVAAYELKKYSQAMMAAERLVDKYPSDARLRIHMARIYIAMGEKESAKAELQQARAFDPSITDDQIEDIVAGLNKQISRWQFNGSVGAGLLYDSNYNQGPTSNNLNIGGWDLFISDAKAKGAWANYAQGGLEGGYRLQEGGSWWLMGDAMTYMRINYGDDVETNRRLTFGRGGLGSRYVGETIMFDARMKLEGARQTHRNADSEDVISWGPEGTFVWLATPSIQSITRANWDERDYSQSASRNGSYPAIGQYGRFFFGEANHEIMAGMRISWADTNFKAYDYFAWEPSLRVKFQLPHDVSIAPFVSYKDESYDGPATGLDTQDRSDEQWRFGNAIAWEVARNVTLDLNYQYIKNHSNSELYDYDQHVTSLGVTCKF